MGEKCKLLQNCFKILQLLKAVATAYIKIRDLFPGPHREISTSCRTAFGEGEQAATQHNTKQQRWLIILSLSLLCLRVSSSQGALCLCKS